MKLNDKIKPFRLTPLYIVAIYVILGELWIFLSDRITFLNYVATTDSHVYFLLSVLKGSLFVFATGLLIYYLIRRSFSHIQATQKQLTENLNHLESVYIQLEETYAQLETTHSEMEAAYEDLEKAEKESQLQLEEIKSHANYLDRFYEGISGGIILQNSAGQVLHANQAACRIMGCNSKDLTDTLPHTLYSAFHNDGAPFSWTDLPTFLGYHLSDPAESRKTQIYLVDPEGYRRWLLLHTDLLIGLRGEIEYLTTFFDITTEEIYRIEEDILREINQKILNNSPLVDLFQFLCEALTHKLGYLGAWIGIKDPDGKVGITANAGVSKEAPFHVRWDDSPEGQGAVGAAFRTGKTQVVDIQNNPFFTSWAPLVKRFNLKWVIALPLIHGNDTVSVLVLYTSAGAGFPEAYQAQLDHFRLKMSLALAYAYNLQDLKHYRFLADQINDTILFSLSSGKIIGVNKAGSQMYGFSQQEFLSQSYGDLIPPSAPELENGQSAGNLALLIENHPHGHTFQTEHRRKNGEIFPIEINAHSADFEGQTLFLSVIRDMSERLHFQNKLAASESRYRVMIEQMSNAVVVLEPVEMGNDFVIKEFNQAAEQIDQIGRNLVIGRPLKKTFPYYKENGILDFYTQVWKTGQPAKAHPVFYQDERLQGWRDIHAYKLPSGELVSIYEDSTPRKAAEEALWQEKERAQVTLDSIGDAVITTDPNGIIDYMNQVASDLTGWSRLEALGHQLEEVFQIIDETTELTPENPVIRCLREGQVIEMSNNIVLLNRLREYLAIEDSAAPIRDRKGNIIGAVLVFHDVSDKRILMKQLAHQAHHDALTGLPNRMLFLDYLNQALEQAASQHGKLGVLFVDLDRFKIINDSLGHGYGDALLKDVAMRLTPLLGKKDAIARHGGDEFLILLSTIEHEGEAGTFAQHIVNSFIKPFVIQGQEVFVTPSIGISIYPDDGNNPEHLIKHADTAMYHAKDKGRNNYQFYTLSLNETLERRLILENNLRRALISEEFLLHYQPIVDLHSGQVTGIEALIRWNSAQEGLISPSAFIPIAEETGLIVPIGEWILHTACSFACELLAKDSLFRWISVNISARQFKEADFAATVAGILHLTGLPANHLHIEITESILMDTTHKTLNTLIELRKLGVSISIDDFGTGFSSLSYLRHLPIDTLKIDQSFVRSLNGQNGAKVVIGIIQLAHSLGLKVVAEGVETDQELSFLEKHRCDQVQGYFYSAPVPADKLRNVLTEINNKSV